MRKIVSFFLIAVFLITPVSAASSSSSDVEYIQKASFWTWAAGQNEFLHGLVGSTGASCPSAEDGYHHASSYRRPEASWGGLTGYYKCICDLCGAEFKAYESDLQQSYEAQVAELPATGYQSNGALRWSPKTLYMSFDTGRYSRAWAYCPDYPGTVKTSSTHNFSFDCDNKSFSIRPSSESTYFYLVEIRLGFDGFFPIVGFYKIIESSAFMQSAVDDNSVLRPGVAFYRAESSGVYHNSGESFFASSSLEAVGSNRYKIFSAQCYPPVYEITPYDSLIGEINTTCPGFWSI